MRDAPLRIYSHIALLAVSVLQVAVGLYAADTDVTQVFGRLNKSVVAVGEPFVYEIEVYGTVDETGQAEALRRAFAASSLSRADDALQLLRVEPTEASVEPALGGTLVARITRRFVFRAETEGVIAVPAPVIEWGGRRLVAARSTVTAYRTTDSFHEVARGIVPIFVERKDVVRQRTYQRTGSGFFIRDDALVTSFHVVAEASRVHVLLPDGKRVESRDIWSVDPIRDVVVLYVNPKEVRAAGVRPLVLAGNDLPSQAHASADGTSDVVFTYGWPGGIRRSTAGLSYRSARLGFDRMWVSSNGVRPGDSGGPLLTPAGEVIGVVTLGTTSDPGPEILREDVCIANDPRPAISQMSLALGTRSMKSMFRQDGFRSRPYVQAFRLMAMITRNERFDEGLREALASFESAINERREDPGLHFMRGILYRMLGTDREANASFADVLRIFEDFFPASYLLGLDHLRRKKFVDAARHFERTREVEPYRNLAEYGLARARMGLHDYEGAVALLDRVLSYDPFFAPALFDISLCYLVLGRSADLTISSARLGHISRRWRRQLDRVVRNPVLQPIRVEELPPAVVRAEL